MGAWGAKAFENDSALDWLGEIGDGGAEYVREALEEVANADLDEYVEVDAASAALAAAEIVASAHSGARERLSEDAAAWLDANPCEAVQVETALARRAVERVLAKSELRELWDENGSETEWHADVRVLLQDLGKTPSE